MDTVYGHDADDASREVDVVAAHPNGTELESIVVRSTERFLEFGARGECDGQIQAVHAVLAAATSSRWD